MKGKEVFLIHDGADPSEGGPAYRSASNGCIKLLGHNGFTKFNNFLISLSGSTKTTRSEQLLDISNANIIKLVVQSAVAPQLKVTRKGP